MQIPLSWLKEFIDLQASPEEIARMLTMAGLEVDSHETSRLPWEGILVGEVLATEKHPEADRLCIARVSDGKEVYQVVCGAPNCRPGLRTAFAPLGAVLKEEGKDFKIKRTKIRGVESFGMLCSGKELNLTADADGILELSDSFQVGASLADYYGDTIFEISLTPNLGHCASILGIARELSAITGLPLRFPSISVKEGEEKIHQHVRVSVLNPEACPRYTCRLIRHVQVGPSPAWLQSRLEKCGLRSINNIVDVTNYVLMELGHPLHAFDYDQLEGHQIIVRKAQESTFQTLDEKQRLLSDQDLMICDANRPVAIAGVMGGMNSEVGNQTRHVLLESAYFDPVTIRKTSKRLGLQTDSSKRFERGTDPNFLIQALDRATMLIQELAKGQVCQSTIDTKAQEFPEKIITCRLSRLGQMLGFALSRGEVEDIFHRLKFNYRWDGQDTFIVTVPTYRVDIQGEIDLIEEVARLYGYDNIPKKGGSYQSSSLPHHSMYVFEEEVRARLIGEGLQEFLTCDLIGPSLLQVVQGNSSIDESMIKVLNPTSVEQSILRTSLLPGLLQVVKYNKDHQNHDIHGFEIGRVHFKDGDRYQESSVAAILLSGKSHPHHWDQKSQDYDFFDLKGIVENLLTEIGIKNVQFRNLNLPTFHSGRQASIFVDSLELGSIGEIHPAILRRLDVSQRVLFGEFNLPDLMQVAKMAEKVKDLPLYPGSERDWTFTIKKTVPFEEVLRLIDAQPACLLEKVSLLDIYQNEKLGTEYQNMTLRFIYRDLSKTVAQEVVEEEHCRLTTAVLNKLGASIKS